MAAYGGAWRVLDFVEWRGELTSREHHLVLLPDRGDPPANVPVADVAVALFGPGVSVRADTMRLLAHHGVTALWCDFRGVPHSATHAWADHSRVTARQRAQAALPEHRKRAAWARIVAAKIDAQARVLEHLERAEAPTLRRMASMRIKSGDSSNLEGQAAVTYFPSLVQAADFTRRDHDNFSINAALDYGYGVFRARVIRSVLSVGLHPPLALFHRGRGNYFALADDLIEPFRPVIDLAVIRANQDTGSSAGHLELTREVKHSLVEQLSTPFAADGVGVAAAMDRLAANLAALFEGQARDLMVPLWRGSLNA